MVLTEAAIEEDLHARMANNTLTDVEARAAGVDLFWGRGRVGLVDLFFGGARSRRAGVSRRAGT